MKCCEQRTDELLDSKFIYTIIEKYRNNFTEMYTIGIGAFGTVYVVKDKYDKEYAIKKKKGKFIKQLKNSLTRVIL